jgi:rhamnosyltransferase
VKTSEVLAVIVSYNGLQKTMLAVEALRPQVSQVHIVDNGSDVESLRVLELLERQPGITVERLGKNQGVGYALNRGVERARQLGCTWLLTMDQDSIVDRSFIGAYRAAIEQDPVLVCLTPRITTRTGRRSAGGVVGYAITSGNLVRISVFNEIGLYDEGMFVDCVDFDFCLRLRKAGYEVYRVQTALMQHQLGEAFDLPRAISGYYARHAPVRRYYMYRNFMYLAERYLLRFPRFIVKLWLAQMILLVLVGCFDPRPLATYRAIARGMWDYVLRKSGPYMDHVK